MPPVHKCHLNCWFHVLVDAIIHEERHNLGIFTIYDGLKCEIEDPPTEIKSIALNRPWALICPRFGPFAVDMTPP